MDVVSRNYELKSLKKSCGNVNIDESEESHSIAVEVLANLLSGNTRKRENVKQQIDLSVYPPLNLSDGYVKEMSSFADLPSGKSMASSYLQTTVTSNKPVFNTKSQYQHQPHILISEANKTYPFVLSTSIPLTTTSNPDLTLPIVETHTDITNDSNLPYLNKDSMMKIQPDNVDSLLILKPTPNNPKLYKVKKVKIEEILNILNDNSTRKSNILSNASLDDSCSTKSEFLTRKRLMAHFAASTTNRSRVNSSPVFRFPGWGIKNASMDDSLHLKSTLGLFSQDSLENRTKSCLPLKKRKIKSTFLATKPLKPHNTNVSVVTGDKEKLILIYKSEQSQLLTDNDEKLRKKIEIALKQDEDGDLPLHIAVAHKNLALIGSFCKLIQRAGKTVDRFNKNKLTPLHLCVKMNYSKGVRKLIKMGADMNLSDGNGNSAVHLAVSYSHFECFDVILKTCSSMENCKPNLDSHNYEGLTPLHTSVQKQNIEMIKKLLEAGADPNSKDYKSGRAPLFFAVENQNQDIIRLLLENKASVDIQNFAGHTAFLVANGRKYQEICKLLVDQGADAHGMVFDDLACNYKTSNVKYQLKNKLVANQSS